MNKIVKFALLATTALSIMGCANNNITREDAGSLEKGMSIRIADSVLKKQSKNDYTILDDSNRYLVRVYGLISGDYASRYFLVFDSSEKLFYWGFRDEFSRSENPILNRIGKKLE